VCLLRRRCHPKSLTLGRLEERKVLEWQDSVEILFGDMRSLPIPEQADILVSELLGSFGDNELSPECLDGAMRILKRTCNHYPPWPFADPGV